MCILLRHESRPPYRVQSDLLLPRGDGVRPRLVRDALRDDDLQGDTASARAASIIMLYALYLLANFRMMEFLTSLTGTRFLVFSVSIMIL